MNRTLRNVILAAAAISWTTAALGADVGVGYAMGPGGYYDKRDNSGPYNIGSDGLPRISGSMTQGSGSIATAQPVAGATATQLAPARVGRGAITIQNLGTTPVYLGGPGVTTATGFLLPGAVGASVTIPTSAAVFGVVGTGTQAVATLETY